jgi:hypothetical protein
VPAVEVDPVLRVRVRLVQQLLVQGLIPALRGEFQEESLHRRLGLADVNVCSPDLCVGVVARPRFLPMRPNSRAHLRGAAPKVRAVGTGLHRLAPSPARAAPRSAARCSRHPACRRAWHAARPRVRCAGDRRRVGRIDNARRTAHVIMLARAYASVAPSARRRMRARGLREGPAVKQSAPTPRPAPCARAGSIRCRTLYLPDAAPAGEPRELAP